MWRRERFILVAVLAAVVLVGSIAGAGCAPTGAGDEELPSPPEDAALPEGMAAPEGMPGGAPYEASMARVAEILGIEEQKLEDAFTQARSEMPEKAPDVRQREALMARVAEILEIEQQKLDDAFAQARSEMPDQGPWQRPANGNTGPWDANKE